MKPPVLEQSPPAGLGCILQALVNHPQNGFALFLIAGSRPPEMLLPYVIACYKLTSA